MLVHQYEDVLTVRIQQFPVEFTGLVTDALTPGKQGFLNPLDHGGHLLPHVPTSQTCGLGKG
jgi:hypothetical protein